MHNLFVSEADLEKRRKKLPQRLSALSKDVSYMQAAYQTLGLKKAIGVHRGQRPSSSYREWRVSLMDLNISMGYFEIWQHVNSLSSMSGKRNRSQRPALYLLQKVNFHIYLPDPSGSDKELLFVHCDPQEPDDSPHQRYKIAPHLHFEVAGSPWNDAHIPLCDGWQSTVLKSLKELDEAIVRAVEFVAQQFAPLVKRN